jgi:hypothetical protein
MTIPAVIGAGTLQKFPNAAVLRSFIYAAMPYWRPASLTEEETWQVTAFLLRQNNLWTAQDELTASNAKLILISTPQAPSIPQPSPAASWILSLIPFIVGLIVLALLIILRRLKR